MEQGGGQELHLYSFMNECTKVISIRDYNKIAKVEKEYFIMILRDRSTTGM